MHSARFVLNRVLLLSVVGLSGCGIFGKKEKPPLQAPAANLSISQYAGSVLSGPQSRAIKDADVKKLWLAKVDLIAVVNLPSEGFSRIASQAKLIIASRNGLPMAASVEIGSTSLIRTAPNDFDHNSVLGDSKTFTTITSQSAAIIPGTSAELSYSSNLATSTAGRRAITIRIGRGESADEYELAIIASDVVSVKSEDSAVTTFVPREETVYLTRKIESDHDRLLLAIPKQFTGNDAKGIIIDLSINAAPTDAEIASAGDAMKKEIAKSSAIAARRIENLSSGSSEEIALSSALSALGQAGDAPRGAMAYLANQTGAQLTDSIVLIADNSQLQLLAKSVVERSQQLQKRDKASVAWLLDRTTIATLAALANDAKNPMSPAIYGALSVYAGDVGRQIDALQSIASQSSGPAEMQVRIVGEQMILLEDNSPAARVRAYDWLRTHNLAPAGYDPLATIKQRREALQKAQATTQPVVQQ